MSHKKLSYEWPGLEGLGLPLSAWCLGSPPHQPFHQRPEAKDQYWRLYLIATKHVSAQEQGSPVETGLDILAMDVGPAQNSLHNWPQSPHFAF